MKKKKITPFIGYICSTPGILLITFFSILPFLMVAVEGFQVDGKWSLDNFIVLTQGRLYRIVFRNTVQISLQVTLMCLVLSIPVAIYSAKDSGRWAPLIMTGVFASFWISILVRTYSWLVILAREGPINDLLLAIGLISQPQTLLFARPGALVVMVNVMLPYMALPLIGFAANNIDWELIQAAQSLGAGGLRILWKILLPILLPGIIAGSFITFMISLSFYITPMLVGGPREIMISKQIDQELNRLFDSGRAGSLSILLLLIVFVTVFITMLSMKYFERRQQAKISFGI